MKKNSVTTQFVPLSTDIKQDIILEMGEMNMEPVIWVGGKKPKVKKKRS